MLADAGIGNVFVFCGVWPGGVGRLEAGFVAVSPVGSRCLVAQLGFL